MALLEPMLPKWSEHLSAYKSACEIHPNLNSFDSKLQQRTNIAIHSLTAEAEKRANIEKDFLTATTEKRSDEETFEAQTTLLLSQHEVHKEVSSHLQDVFQGVANIIVERKDHVWESKALKSLVHAYLDSTRDTISILDKIEKCVEEADDGQRYILQAVAQFEKDSAEKDVGGKKKKFEKTLIKLKKYKAIGDPFSDHELKNQFELVKKQQESLLEKVSDAIKELQEEIDHLDKAMLIMNCVVGAVFAVAAVASIALMATGVGAPLGVALAVSLPLIAIGWVGAHTILANRRDGLEKQMEALQTLKNKYESVGHGIEINETELESVSQHVERLEDKISSILNVVDDAIDDDEDETDIRYDLNTIRENVQKLTQGIKEVGEAVSRARELIEKARDHVMENITNSA